ncbi:MAG: 50S ribosomal protein L23 [Pseudomonadota bacterium]|nr:50S ribosomal protein L23 [Pseudomonadota bacterium]
MSGPIHNERLIKVLLGPHVSEKTAALGEKHNQVCFKVLRDSTKAEVAAAVEMMFEVKVDKVRVSNVRGKIKRFGQTLGKRADWKKAYVSLAEGYDIDFLGAE